MAQTMKAAVWHGKKDIRVEDVAVPAPPKADEVQIEVSYCGICGSDLHEYLAGPIFIPTAPHPLTGHSGKTILGHEFSGKVVAVGSAVTNVRVGDLIEHESHTDARVERESPLMMDNPQHEWPMPNYPVVD